MIHSDNENNLRSVEHFNPNDSIPFMSYKETLYDFPICNHCESVSEENIGYTQGILKDGIPFEAELCQTKDELTLQVILPLIKDFYDEETLRKIKESQDEFNKENDILLPNVESIDATILAIGMIDGGYSDDPSLFIYVDYLEENDLVRFKTAYKNGALHYLEDSSGNHLVGVLITLEEHGKVLAETKLRFRPFKKNHATIKIVK